MSENAVNIFEKKAEEMTAMNIISPSDTFTLTAGGTVMLDHEGTRYNRVKIVRLFPFSDADRYLSVRDHDDSDREIGIIEDLELMNKESRDVIRHQLDLCYFTPVINKIMNIKDEYGFAYFHVMTDKGECRFAINMGSNAVTKLSDTRLIIMDIDENRFEIRDVEALSQKEKRMLDLFL